jgi:hypothetical protein
MFPELYKRSIHRRRSACNWQCVSWPTFEVIVAHGCDYKVDETRKAGMSNMKAFPAVVVFWQNGKRGALSVAPSNLYCYMRGRGGPCREEVPIAER